MKNIRILHISDIHLSVKSKRHYGLFPMTIYDSDILEGVTSFIYQCRDAIDAILVSGDISTTGYEEDIVFSQKLLLPTDSGIHPSFPWLRTNRFPTLAFYKKPIIIVPGNHDRFCDNEKEDWPGSLFDNYFGEYWHSGPGGVQYRLVPNDEDPVFAVICADFTLATIDDRDRRWGHLGQGMVYPKRLDWINETSESISEKAPDVAKILLIHFAPECEVYFKSKKLKFKKYHRLLESNQLINATNNTDMTNIFCGHTHISHGYTIEKTDVNIYCTGTSACKKKNENAALHIYDLEIEKSIITDIIPTEYRWNGKEFDEYKDQ